MGQCVSQHLKQMFSNSVTFHPDSRVGCNTFTHFTFISFTFQNTSRQMYWGNVFKSEMNIKLQNDLQ